jgi:hypothetical protein
VSPILVRPVREQLEHDRVIRLLELRLKRKNEVATNIGAVQTVPVKIGQVQIYPDLVLTTSDKSHKLLGTVEVETAESVNHLEAMAQWAHLGRARAPFHLYVPANCVEIARRLATENHVNVSELWSFHTIGDQTRFTLVQKNAQPEPRKAPETVVASPAKSPASPAAPIKVKSERAVAPASKVKAAPSRPAASKAKAAVKTKAKAPVKAAKKAARPTKRK